MPAVKLDLGTLAVETFAPAETAVAGPATIANCSAIDACLSRLCDTSRC